ncbi:transcription factor S [Thermoproteota archaeon]|jgi:DNA-directed RNA polymerase subunit M
MNFCPNCGTTLIPTKKENKVAIVCPKCNYETKKGAKEVSKIKHDKEKIIVIGKEEQKIRTLPKTSAVCPKCGHPEAFYWLVQTRGADESSTQFLRCTRCASTWREMS